MNIKLKEQDPEKIEELVNNENLIDYADLLPSNGHISTVLSDDLEDPTVIIEIKAGINDSEKIDKITDRIVKTFAEQKI